MAFITDTRRAMLRILLKTLLLTGLLLIAASLALVIALRFVNPPASAVILFWEWQHDRTANYVWQPLERISPHLQLAVIASEDQKFPQHYGFDFEAIRDALNEHRQRPRGASTITQQVAKNLFLWQGRSYLRKLLEAWFSLLMETLWSKQRILEIYLNIAEFGEGIYGAEAASRQFFRRPAAQLNTHQSSLLAAVLPSPKQLFAANPSDYVSSRALKIRQMGAQLGGTRYLDQLAD